MSLFPLETSEGQQDDLSLKENPQSGKMLDTGICPLWHSLNTILSNAMLTKKYSFNKFNPNIPEVYGN